jgi:tRNA-guanine family transglycosylase
MAGEINASSLNTLHNLNFYLDTMRGIRESVQIGRFESFRQAFHQSFSRQPADSE